MKVLALIYGDEASWEAASEEARNTVMTQYRAFGESADGRILEGAELAAGIPGAAHGAVEVRAAQEEDSE